MCSDAGGVGEAVVSVSGVGKRYDIYARPSHRLLQAMSRSKEKYVRRFWALSGVSFELKRGDAVGIIGRNGSGKSTLMQIIAGTLAPTTGEVRVRGRVAALLELGSGFNPEFTGRENAYLSGAILGISKKEMDRRIEEIEAFADIGEFFDEPIDTYSSGMSARLAFSVAVSVKPEILILDEVLSVGDAAFQQKCIGRMRALLSGGVTLLFVSHNADAVKSICNKGLFLIRGKPAHFGTSEEAVNAYLNHLRGANNHRALAVAGEVVDGEVSLTPALEEPGLGPTEGSGSGHGRIVSVRLSAEDGTERDGFRHGEKVVLDVVVRSEVELARADVAFMVRDKTGIDVFGSSALEEGRALATIRAGEAVRVRFVFRNVLRSGAHGVSVTFTRRPDVIGDAILTVEHRDAAAAFVCVGDPDRRVRGKVYVPVEVEHSVVGVVGAAGAGAV
jgi:lipopolysaccharide transport system ATP-binding protein